MLDAPRESARTPYVPLLLIGLGGLFAGVTGPLLSTFVPPLVRDALGEHRTAIGAVMAIDNVLLLLLVPWAGAASDRASARGRGRLPIVLCGFVLAASGMALFPVSAAFGIAGLIGAIVVLYAGINIQRSPFQALIADLVPSRYRSLATGSVTFQMCVGAIVFLMLGRMLGMRPAFLIAAGAVLAIAGGVRPRASRAGRVGVARRRGDVPLAPRCGVVRRAGRGAGHAGHLRRDVPAAADLSDVHDLVRAARHRALRRPAGRRDDRLHRVGGRRRDRRAARRHHRRAHRPAERDAARVRADGRLPARARQGHEASQATPLLALASACWTLPTVNAYPLFVEPIPRQRRGVLASLFLLCMALGGAIGDPLNGSLFDLVGGYRPLFLMMAGYTALAFVAVLFVPRGAGEADTGPDSVRPSATAG